MAGAINVYSISQATETINENLPEIFERLGYKQTFSLVDTKLIIGYSIGVVAGASFLLDKKFKHNDLVLYQQILVALYFILSGIFWWFRKFVEKGAVYTGKKANGDTIKVRTSYVDAEPKCQITFINGDKKVFEPTLEINKVYTETGYLQIDLMYEWIKQQLETMGAKKE